MFEHPALPGHIGADALQSSDGSADPEAGPELGGHPDEASALSAVEPPTDGATPGPRPDATNQDDASAAVDSRTDGPRAGDLYDVQPGSCIERLIANGYAADPTTSCSSCTDGNGGSLAAKCTAMIDCLAPPRTSADFTYCLNFIKGSSLVRDCVADLLNPACRDGY